jgi:hypothetical protein
LPRRRDGRLPDLVRLLADVAATWSSFFHYRGTLRPVSARFIKEKHEF